MDLSDRHRHFLRIEQGVHPFLINLVLNGLIAWGLLRSHETIPLWGNVSMGVDLLATGFLLPFLMCLIVSRVIAKQVESGKVPPLEAAQLDSRGLQRRSILVRGLVLGAAGVVLASGPLVLLLDLAGAQPVTFLSFVGFKAIWAGLLALMMSPVIAWWALAAASEEPALATAPA